jgi:NAD(P)H-quinone oxidoreductase subunit 5
MDQILDLVLYSLGVAVVVSPALMCAALGIPSLIGKPLSERTTNRVVQTLMVVGLVSSLAILALMLITNRRFVPVDIAHLELAPREHHAYHFNLEFTFDRLSVPFCILTFMLCGTVGAFAHRYMHRERGFNRFFMLYSLFVAGMTTTSLAGTIETLFAGWELVGLSSALLVAFFHERPAPVSNGLRVWIVYRIADAALLVASVSLHHLAGGGDFDKFLGKEPWPEGVTTGILPHQAAVVGFLLLIAAAGKSALVPFSGWLPRAMEGPTPSSAVFYGALSVHLGAFLLLRFSPIIEQSPAVQWAIIVIGLATAAFAAFAGRVQCDIKCALTFASLTQVGLITAEIGFGFRYLAIIHILGHGCFRTLQFLRAPSLLYDYNLMENALGKRLAERRQGAQGWLPPWLSTWLYRFALERGYLDSLLADSLIHPVLALFRFFDRLERRWMAILSEPSPPRRKVDESPLEDLL